MLFFFFLRPTWYKKMSRCWGETIIMAPERPYWDVLRSAVTPPMLQLLYRSVITVVGEVDCGLLAQTRIKQGLGQKKVERASVRCAPKLLLRQDHSCVPPEKLAQALYFLYLF